MALTRREPPPCTSNVTYKILMCLKSVQKNQQGRITEFALEQRCWKCKCRKTKNKKQNGKKTILQHHYTLCQMHCFPLERLATNFLTFLA